MNRNLAFVAIIYDRIGTRIKDVFENDAGNNLAQFFNLNPGAESLLTQLEHVDTEEQINAPPNVGLVIRDVIDDPISELLEKLEDHDSPLEFGNRLQHFSSNISPGRVSYLLTEAKTVMMGLKGETTDGRDSGKVSALSE